jgi:D-inositol-3-phosphate glycosyltransferase
MALIRAFSPRAEGVSSIKECSELLFVGRLRVEKGLLVLLKAIDILNNEQEGSAQGKLHLNIFGTGDEVYIRDMESFLREKGLTQVVIYHGKVPQDELIGHYDRADILLVPSLWHEPFGLVVAEAMARGLPVIASNIGGPAEILTHEVNGLLIEPNDEHALATAIRELLDHPEKRRQLSQAARETVQQRFTIEENARRVEYHLLRAIELSEGEFLATSVPSHRSS